MNLGGIRISGALGLERRKDHPEHREKQKDGNYPGYQRPKVTPCWSGVSGGGATLAAGARRWWQSCQATAAVEALKQPRQQPAGRMMATISVRMSTMIPAAAPTPQ